jgi:hypothetical protein
MDDEPEDPVPTRPRGDPDWLADVPNLLSDAE